MAGWSRSEEPELNVQLMPPQGYAVYCLDGAGRADLRASTRSVRGPTPHRSYCHARAHPAWAAGMRLFLLCAAPLAGALGVAGGEWACAPRRPAA
eukprot:4353028-Prymnesium_polylepis.1